MIKFLKKLFNKFAENTFVDKFTCLNCGNEYANGSEYGVCEKCFKKLSFNSGHKCLKCGTPMKNEAKYCISCMNTKRYFTKAYSVYIYENEIKKIIQKYKFQGKAFYYKYLANSMVNLIQNESLQFDIIAYIPLDKIRESERGYNQAKLLAEHISEKLNIELFQGINKKHLEKHQHELTAIERTKSLENAFTVENNLEQIKNKTVLLVDDIITTGTTVNVVSNELLKRKAKNIIVLALSATPNKIYLS